MSTKQNGMEYEHTVIYGHYNRPRVVAPPRKDSALGQIQDARKPSRLEVFAEAVKEAEGCHRFKRCCGRCCSCVWSRVSEDWVFLAVLGVIMALLSYGIDYIILKCHDARIWLFEELDYHISLQYFVWVGFTVGIMSFSVAFTQVVAANAIGSGIPEMKTIMRGIPLKEYLTFKTLLSKIVGLCTALGSGMPLGKEGPFVHIASIVATLMSRLIGSFRGMYEEESRNSEMLAAACAVGVACTFAAPIGGVLFSIEVTSAYFAVKNYWRGFFAAVCSATIFRLLAILSSREENLTALFKTSFRLDFPFDTMELLVFSLMGVVCGLAGALFVYLHRRIVMSLRNAKRLSAILKKNRFLYPTFVVLIAASIRFPLGSGKYFAGKLTFHQAIDMFFKNYTWTELEAQTVHAEELYPWLQFNENVFLSLTFFVVVNYGLAIVCNTLPVPAGVFVPVFTVGAGFGRLVGEVMATIFPHGIKELDDTVNHIIPGGYAVVGAAALSGSVTHTVSTAIIVFELTGQIQHILPAVIAVLVSNAIAHSLQPSIYDSMIQIKGLPYLPNINANKQTVTSNAADIMVKEIKRVSQDMTYRDVSELIQTTSHKVFPLVDSKDTMVLLGSVSRNVLFEELERQLTRRFAPSPPALGSVLETEQTHLLGPAAGNIQSPVPFIPLRTNSQEHQQSDENTGASSSDPTPGPSGEGSSSQKIGRFSVKPVTEGQQEKDNVAVAAEAAKRQAEAVRTEDETEASKKGSGSGARAYDTLPLMDMRTRPSILKRCDSLDGLDCLDDRKKRRDTLKRQKTSPDFLDTRGSDSEYSQTSSLYGTLKRILKRVQMHFLPRKPPKRVIQVSEDEAAWEQEQLSKQIEMSRLQIDPSPYQLVEETSLYKVHKVFALLNLHHAYVTKLGRLVGVVSMKEIRDALTPKGNISAELQRSIKRRHTGERRKSVDMPFVFAQGTVVDADTEEDESHV